MFSYGSRAFGYGAYGGTDTPQIVPVPCIIEVYDAEGDRKATFQTGCGDFIGCDFVLDESGCKNFTLYFSSSQNLIRKDTVKIKIFGSLDNFFCGVIREIPIEGSTEQKFNYSGYGFNDYLLRINSGALSYANKTIEYIIDDLLDNIITVKTPIIRNNTKLSFPAITITSLVVNYSQIPEVLDALKKIASSSGEKYIMGVDQEGEFFFRPRSTDVKKTLIVGKLGDSGIDKYEPQESFETRTKYYVLDKNGTYKTTINSTVDNDIYEEKLTAPDIDDTSITNWANGIMIENEASIKTAAIQWKIENVDPLLLTGDGNIRIISNVPPISLVIGNPNPYGSGTYGSGLYGGGQSEWKTLDDELRVIEVSYVLNNNQFVRNIQLGNKLVTLDESFLKVRKELVDLKVSLGV